MKKHFTNISWQKILNNQFDLPYMKTLESFLRSEYSSGKIIYPQAKNIFNAFNLTNFEDVKVVILGQDPYHNINQAHGLSFSVPEGVKIPPSLRNILKEIKANISYQQPLNGCLECWAKQGVLLLNSVLTVEAHKPASHQKRGWETFTDYAIHQLAQNNSNIVFMLWGAYAQKKCSFIDKSKHLVLKSSHPSPLSAYKGFLGNKHFIKANNYLAENNIKTINWNL